MRVKFYASWLRRSVRNYKHGKHGRHFYAMKVHKKDGELLRSTIYRFTTMDERDVWCRSTKATPVSAIEARKNIFKRGTFWLAGELIVGV